MLIELLSMSNYGNYNIKLANILGLESAVYINELLNINEKALRKNKISDNFFTLDREYIKSRTTLSLETQLELDDKLMRLGILEHSDENTISINITVMTSILMDPSEELMKTITKVTKSKSGKRTKGQAICDNLKSNIVTSNEELIAAYSEWIDAVYAKDGWMSKKAVVCAQQTIDEFANRNLDVALEVLKIATINGYRDINYAINNFKKMYNVSYKITPPPPIKAESPSDNNMRNTKRLSPEIF